jgi:hypothetical protein
MQPIMECSDEGRSRPPRGWAGAEPEAAVHGPVPGGDAVSPPGPADGGDVSPTDQAVHRLERQTASAGDGGGGGPGEVSRKGRATARVEPPGGELLS